MVLQILEARLCVASCSDSKAGSSASSRADVVQLSDEGAVE